MLSKTTIYGGEKHDFKIGDGIVTGDIF